MRTIPPILCLGSDVLYAHPEIVARIVIVIQSILQEFLHLDSLFDILVIFFISKSKEYPIEE